MRIHFGIRLAATTAIAILIVGMINLPLSRVPISQSTLKPFFDTVNNPEQHGFPRGRKEDITPPPPQLSAFDRDVLKICGEIGSRVSANDFKQLMLNNRNILLEIKQAVGGQLLPVRRMLNHRDVLREIQKAVSGQLLPVRRTEAEFLDDLTAIWSRREGFEHIFCGELEATTKIGGLHYVGRYLQLQNERIGGRLPNNLQKEEVIPGVVYTVGVQIEKNNQTWRDDRKGYPLVTDAREMLLSVTKAYKLQGNAQGACILPVQDGDSGKSYNAVFVKDRNAIVTFYPDATPQGRPCRN